MSDDFDFDDDEDIDLDDDGDELAASSSDVAPVADDDEAPAGKPAKPYDPNAPVPFFKNWIWWVSLVAAVPGGIVAASVVLDSIDHAGANFNWLMYALAFMTFFFGAAAAVMPLLLALGFFLGGKEVKAPDLPAAAESNPASDAGGDFDDDEGGFDEDDDELFEDDEDDDDFDF